MLRNLSYRDYGSSIIAAAPNPFVGGAFSGGAADIFRMHCEGATFPAIEDILRSRYPEYAEDISQDIRAVAAFFDSGSSPAQLDGEVKPNSDISGVVRFAREHKLLTNATIELTTKCNLRCRHCFHPTYTSPGLDTKKLIALLEELRDIGVLFLCFTGGELFARSDAEAILSMASELGFLIELKTNGTLLSRDIAARLASLRISDIQFSIYGLHDGENAFTGGQYHFSKVEEAIRAVRENGIPYSMAFQVTPENVDDLDSAYRKLSDIGGSFYFSYYVTPKLSDPLGNSGARLTYHQLKERLLPRLKKWDMVSEPTPYRTRDCGPVCWAGFEQVFIDATGIVFPCPDLRIALGDINRTSLRSITDSRFHQLANIMPTRLPVCDACSHYEYCDSCIGVALSENGSVDIPSQHKCDLTQLLFERG